MKLVNKKNSMAEGTFFLTLARIVFISSGYIIHFILSHNISQETYGRFNIVLSFITYFTILSVLGLPTAVQKKISEGANLKELRTKALKIQFILSIFIFTFIFFSTPLLLNLLKDPKLKNLIFYMNIIILLKSLFGILNSFPIGLRKFKTAAQFLSLNSILRLVGVLFVFYFSTKINLEKVLIAYIFPYLICILFILINIRKEIFLQDKKGKKATYQDILFFSFPNLFFSLVYIIINNFDLWVIKANNNPAGYYGAVKNLSNIGLLVFESLAITLLPALAYSYAKKNFKKVKNNIFKITRYSLLILIPSFFLMLAFSREIISLFYPIDYVIVSPLLILMFGAVSLLTLFKLNIQILNAFNKPFFVGLLSLIILLIYLPLTIYLVKLKGLWGGGVSLLIVSAISFLISALKINKIIKGYLHFFSIVKIIIASIIIYLLSYFMTLKGMSLIIGILILAIIYLFLLYLMKEIKKEELKRIISFFANLKLS